MHLWCPSLQEVKQVFHSLGAFNPALYPQGPYQHRTRCVALLPHCRLLSGFLVTLAYRIGTAAHRLPVGASVSQQTMWLSGLRAQTTKLEEFCSLLRPCPPPLVDPRPLSPIYASPWQTPVSLQICLTNVYSGSWPADPSFLSLLGWERVCVWVF